jgi:Alpha-mannosidase
MNHLDLTWRRPRYSAAIIDKYQLIPYAEIQEKQIDSGIDFAREGGCYCIEQTISLREYIERNPDSEEEITQMICDGRLIILGGGESIIDYNLPDGECLVRNHLYSRRWLKNKFNIEPKFACCPDTFGLSANLPALFRELGYKGISQYHRVFQEAKPVWRGISGDRVALETAKMSSRPTIGMGSFMKSRVCGICGGIGCSCCCGYGFVLEYAPRYAYQMDNMLDAIIQNGRSGDVNFIINGEESLPPKGACEKLRVLAEKAGMEIRFIGFDALIAENYGDMLNRIDSLAEEFIDPRLEGNPVAAGCYTTRIKLKQENRRCEATLRAAESLAVAASLDGDSYPVKTFERLWRMMSFLQFHDALPASHSDDAYAELMETGRQIRASASRIINHSAETLMGKIAVAEGDGIPFVVMNPLEFDVKDAVLSGAVIVGEEIRSGIVISPDGSRHMLTSFERSVNPESKEACITFFGGIPAFGYGIFRFLPSDEELAQPKPCRRGVIMENEFLRVELNECCVKSIVDKRSGRVIAADGSFAPMLSDDAGHPWGRTNSVQYSERADMPNYWENMMPARECSHEVSYCRRGELQIAEIHITYARDEKQIELLDWTAELILADGSDNLKVKIKTSLNARDIKLSTAVVLPEVPTYGMIDYEIPLGRIARGYTNAYDGQLGYADEWPALRYVSAKFGGQTVTLCNNGTPGHSINGNIILVSLIRTPTQMCCGYGLKGAIDRSMHTFDFILHLSPELTPLEEYRCGMVLNSHFPTFPIDLSAVKTINSSDEIRSGSYMRLPNDTPLLALKSAEDGDGYICRYLGCNKTVNIHFDRDVEICSLLEENTGKKISEIEIKPYSIMTLRLRKEDLMQS